MNLSPVEAINRINETVTVEMLVQRTKCGKSGKAFLDSEADHHDPKNLGVVVTEDGRGNSIGQELTTRPPTTTARPSGFMGW